MCSAVLNLLLQDGSRPVSSALTFAYRVPVSEIRTLITTVGTKPIMRHHVHSRALILYHTIPPLGRLVFRLTMYTSVIILNSSKGQISQIDYINTDMSIIRSFIAIELPNPIQENIRDTIKWLQLSGVKNVRWVQYNNIHLTLKFLGDITTSDIENICIQLKQLITSYGSFKIQLDDLGAFPSIRKPQVIWIGLKAHPCLWNLQKNIEETLSSSGFSQDDRPFFPHLTLGRIKKDATSQDISEITAILNKKYDHDNFSATLDCVTLFRSDLKPNGAFYTPIFQLKLSHEY